MQKCRDADVQRCRDGAVQAQRICVGANKVPQKCCAADHGAGAHEQVQGCRGSGRC